MSENAGGPHHTALVCAVRPCRTGSWPALPRDEQYPAFHDCSASSQQHAWWKEGEWRERERGRGRERGEERGKDSEGGGRERGEERGKDSEGEEEEGRRKEKRKERRGRSARGRRRGERE